MLFSNTSGMHLLARCSHLIIVIKQFETFCSIDGAWFLSTGLLASFSIAWSCEMTWRRKYLSYLGTQHSWRQLILQHVLHGVCLKSKNLPAREFVSCLAFFNSLLISVQKMQVCCTSFHQSLWQMWQSALRQSSLENILKKKKNFYKRCLYICQTCLYGTKLVQLWGTICCCVAFVALGCSFFCALEKWKQLLESSTTEFFR